MPEEKEEKPKTRRSPKKKKEWYEGLEPRSIPRELWGLTCGQMIRMKTFSGRVAKISAKGLPLEIDYRDDKGVLTRGEAFKLEDYVGLK